MNTAEILTLITLIVGVIHYMFPNLFPTIGNYLKRIKWYVWIISLLVLITIGQTYFIYF